MTDVLTELLVIHSYTWNYFILLTYVYKSYISMYQLDLALNNLQWLICNKTQPNQQLNFFVSLLSPQKEKKHLVHFYMKVNTDQNIDQYLLSYFYH